MGDKVSSGKNTPTIDPALLDRKSQNSLRKSDIGQDLSLVGGNPKLSYAATDNNS